MDRSTKGKHLKPWSVTLLVLCAQSLVVMGVYPNLGFDVETYSGLIDDRRTSVTGRGLITI